MRGKNKTDFSDVEPGEVLFENVALNQQIEKVSTSHVLENLVTKPVDKTFLD